MESDTSDAPSSSLPSLPMVPCVKAMSSEGVMGPPPPRPKPPAPIITAEEEAQNGGELEQKKQDNNLVDPFPIHGDIPSTDVAHASSAPPYSIPPWSSAPAHPFSLEILKDGSVIANFDLSQKGAYMFGRSDRCDLILEHPTISRYHAVLQFKRNGDAFVYDLGSTHGTFVNKLQTQAREYVHVHVGDILKFGLSTRLYVLQGPTELMPKEGPARQERHLLRQLQAASKQADLEASLLRAKRDAITSEGATWGMMEDAIEEEPERDEDEVTWQNYKGVLTEKQQKTLEKIQKRHEKLMNLRKEIDAIQAKEIPQGGLTQGQQTQVARNEQRIEQVMEEVENLEETLNQSIQESIGGRTKNKKQEQGDDEDEDLSDDDEFYDRTKQGSRKNKEKTMAQVVETAESLLEKKERLTSELENLSKLLEAEEKIQIRKKETLLEHSEAEHPDPLDAFMSSVSSKLVEDNATRLRKEIERQQIEYDRVVRLLKIADPTGEASKKKDQEKETSSLSDKAVSPSATRQTIPSQYVKAKEDNFKSESEKLHKALEKDDLKQGNMLEKSDEPEKEIKTQKSTTLLSGPVWLGAGNTQKEMKEPNITVSTEEDLRNQKFVEYRERNKSKDKTDKIVCLEESLEDAAGLILRKPVIPVEKSDSVLDETELWAGAEASAAESVAQLLRHERGLGVIADEDASMYSNNYDQQIVDKQAKHTRKKRKLGPERPAFLDAEKDTEYDSWLPPEGQSGDGRTSLNAKLGY